MNEADLAAAVASGEAPSPSPFGNSILVALRVSGTGVADRPARSERVIRDPQIWLSPETQDRVRGLSVILDHPASDLLTGPEFALRSLGAVIHAYVGNRGGLADPDGPDLWGIARLFVDPETMAELASGSTSPAVAFNAESQNQTIELADGNVCLVEGNPDNIDHLAIVSAGAGGAGVWDRGDPNQRGIRIDNPTEINVTDEEKAACARADAEANEKKDREERARKDAEGDLGGMASVMSALDAICKRLDAMESKASPTKDEDAREEDKPLDPAAEREREVSLADIQSRADRAASCWGERAPGPMSGESIIAYRKRMLRRHQRHSKAFADADLDLIAKDPKAFGSIEQQIYADSETASERPEGPADGRMIKRQRTTDSGHTVTEWHGRETIFKQFSTPPLFATSFMTPQHRGN